MNSIRSVTKNFFSLTLAEAFNRMLGVLVIAFLARKLGPDSFGTLNIAASIANYFVFFTDMGLMVNGIKQIAGKTSAINDIISDVMSIRLLLCIASYGLLGIIAFTFVGNPILRLLVVLSGLTLLTQSLSPTWIYQGTQKMEFCAGHVVVQGLAYALLVFLSVRTASDIYFVPLVLFAGGMIADVLFFIPVRKMFGKLRLRFELRPAIAVLRGTTPIGISTFLICTVNWNVSTTLMGIFLKSGTPETGYFSAAFKVILVLIGVAVTFQIVLYPVIASLAGSDRPKLTDIMHRVDKLVFTAGIPLIAGTLAVGGPVVTAVFGQKFLPAARVLNLLIAGSLFYAFNVIYFNLLISAGYVRKNFIVNIFHAALLVGLSIPAIIYGKAAGAAAAYTITEFVAFVITLYAIRPFYRASIITAAVRPSIAAVLMFILLRCFPGWHYAPLIALGAVSYVLFLFLFRGITRDDFVVFRGLLRKD